MNTIISIPRHSSIPRFAKKNGAVFFQSRDGIELGDLERIAPSVFAEGAHDSRSQRYTHIPTRDVLMALDKEGFVPYSVMQGGFKGRREARIHEALASISPRIPWGCPWGSASRGVSAELARRNVGLQALLGSVPHGLLEWTGRIRGRD